MTNIRGIYLRLLDEDDDESKVFGCTRIHTYTTTQTRKKKRKQTTHIRTYTTHIRGTHIHLGLLDEEDDERKVVGRDRRVQGGA